MNYCSSSWLLQVCVDTVHVHEFGSNTFFFHMRYSSVSRSAYAYAWFLVVHSCIYLLIQVCWYTLFHAHLHAAVRWLKYCRYGVKHQSISQYTRHTSTDSFLIKSWCRSRNRPRIAEYQSVYIYVRYSLVFHTSFLLSYKNLNCRIGCTLVPQVGHR